jgi:hypothetical protein
MFFSHLRVFATNNHTRPGALFVPAGIFQYAGVLYNSSKRIIHS